MRTSKHRQDKIQNGVEKRKIEIGSKNELVSQEIK